MSVVFLDWATNEVSKLKPLDRALLMTIAKKADDSGRWRITMEDLIAVVGVTRNPVRAALDRLAERGVLTFKTSTYRGRAQGAHDFRLVRNDLEMRSAVADGYGIKRCVINRNAAQSATDKNERGWVKNSPRGVGQKLTEGRSAISPRVGELSHRHTTLQNTSSKLSPREVEKPSLFEDLLFEWGAIHPVRKTDPIQRACSYFDEVMSAEEKALSIKYARAFRSDLAAEKRSHIPHLVNALRDKFWLSYATTAPTEYAGVFIAFGSPQWRAWDIEYCRERKKLTPRMSAMHKAEGCWQRTLWPPSFQTSDRAEEISGATNSTGCSAPHKTKEMSA